VELLDRHRRRIPQTARLAAGLPERKRNLRLLGRVSKDSYDLRT
jgi:hypothetical protein